MAKTAKPSKKLPSLAITLSLRADAVLNYIRDRYPDPETGERCSRETAAEICILGYGGRKYALDKHAAKVRAVRAARAEGKVAKDVAFKRYVPIFKAKTYDAPETEREVAKWSHAAPVKSYTAEPVEPVKESKPKKAPKAPKAPKAEPVKESKPVVAKPPVIRRKAA